MLKVTDSLIISFFHRLLTMLGFQQFLAQDGDVTLELVEEGKEHIKREKRRRQRLAESATRRRDFANRFGDIEANSRGKIKVHFLNLYIYVPHIFLLCSINSNWLPYFLTEIPKVSEQLGICQKYDRLFIFCYIVFWEQALRHVKNLLAEQNEFKVFLKTNYFFLIWVML